MSPLVLQSVLLALIIDKYGAFVEFDGQTEELRDKPLPPGLFVYHKSYTDCICAA
jgi:hypothetical protein